MDEIEVIRFAASVGMLYGFGAFIVEILYTFVFEDRFQVEQRLSKNLDQWEPLLHWHLPLVGFCSLMIFLSTTGVNPQ